jgi:hypothetical protein
MCKFCRGTENLSMTCSCFVLVFLHSYLSRLGILGWIFLAPCNPSQGGEVLANSAEYGMSHGCLHLETLYLLFLHQKTLKSPIPAGVGGPCIFFRLQAKLSQPLFSGNLVKIQKGWTGYHHYGFS